MKQIFVFLALFSVSCGVLSKPKDSNNPSPIGQNPTPLPTTPPTAPFVLVRLLPQTGSTNVTLGAELVAEFSHNLLAQQREVLTTLLKVQDGPGSFLEGTVTVERNLLKMKPARSLPPGKQLAVTLSSKVLDDSGRELGEAASSNFSTLVSTDTTGARM